MKSICIIKNLPMRVNLKVLLSLIFYYFANISISKSQCLTCTTNNPLNSGLIWCHPFSGNANDVTGNGYDGFVSGATLIPDRAGNLNSAYNFNGTSSYISISKLLPSFLPTFSMSMWLKPGTNTGNGFVLWEGDNVCGNDIYLVVQNSTLKLGANKNSSLGGISNIGHTYTIPGFINTWTHIVWVMEPTTSRLYVNGNLVITINAAGNGSGYNFPTSYGSKFDGNGGSCGAPRQFYYQGGIDDVRLYNRSLSASEALSLYNISPGTPPIITSITDRFICKGDSIQVNPIVSNATNFSWSPTSGVINPNIINPFFKPSASTTYILSASNSQCTERDTFSIYLNSLNLELGANRNICLGDSIRLNPIISNASTFSWTPATGISNTGISNPFLKPISTTTYILTASNNSCSIKDTVTIVVNNISLEVGPDKNICPGDSIQIIPIFSNVDNFSWQPTLGVSNSVISSPYFKPTTTTNYILTATNSSCTIKDTVRIQVNGISLELGADKTFCPGDSIKINPTIVNANNFSWLPITGLSNPNISNPNFKPSVTTKYILTASNNFCALKDSITIHVNDLSLELGLNRNICPGDSVQLNPIFTNANNFLWTPNLGISSPTISNPILKPDTTTKYILTANNTSCSISDTILIQVNNLRILLGPNKNICLGDSIRINPFTSNVSSFNWSPSIFVSNTGIENPFLKPTTSTKFYLDVSNSSCSLKDSVEITVNTISLELGSDKTICLGDSIILNPLAGNGNFLWSPATGLNTINSKNTIAKPISNIKYYLNHTNGACSMIDSVTISVNSISVELGTDKSVCLGDSIRINPITINTSNYSWSPTNGISDPLIKNPFFSPNISTKYFLLVSDGLCSAKDSISIETKIISLNAGLDQTICLGDSIQLNAIAGIGNYSWYPKIEISDTSISNPIVQPKNDRKYFISYEENGCRTLDSILVIVRQIGLDAGIDKTICLGDSIQILANQFGGSNLIWSPAIGLSDINIIQPWAKPVSTQKYKLKIDDGVCFKSDSLTITILDKSLISKSNDTMICSGNSVQLNIIGGTNLQWLNPYNLDLSNVSKPVASPLIDTIYIVKFSTNGCWFFDSISIKVNKSPFIDAGRDTFHCFENFVKITGNKGNSLQSYWQSNPYFSDTLKLDQIVSIKNQYKFILTGNSNGCFSFDTIVVNERPKVTADFTVFPESGLTPLDINLKNTSTNYTIFSWVIDGTSSNGLDPDTSFIYNNKKDLSILLTVFDSSGCTDTISKTIKINVEPVFKIPNVFTPNVDYSNDYFEILHNPEAFKYVEYEVYNRWGQLLYKTKMPGGKWWDGTFDGNPCPEGVYFYIAIGEALNGKMFNAHGTLTLLR